MVSREHAQAPFSGKGARLFGGRWNSKGRAVCHLADSPALCQLEVLASTRDHRQLEAKVLFRARGLPRSVRSRFGFRACWIRTGRLICSTRATRAFRERCRRAKARPIRPTSDWWHGKKREAAVWTGARFFCRLAVVDSQRQVFTSTSATCSVLNYGGRHEPLPKTGRKSERYRTQVLRYGENQSNQRVIPHLMRRREASAPGADLPRFGCQ